ncbi:efflux RND transporter periplasmic adaptor subunit [Candidatus Uabimicrobium amorphum]|uniref:Acriflavin resistance protein n=1 Tax=Uabimicrobium amorphum TaxID=2596890 RepID=A0A5S9IQU3_UABAM|nr:efflux RND transporter periplasmic adaptor subunit [Candidatus Uabimicrobium amorphum]BBM86389.1 acriflavin resistance protein [Candidatus Uabimicrobium amorphum]
MFSLEKKQQMIGNIDLFKSISPEKQKIIAQRLGVKNFIEGEVIFSEGSWGNEAFVICEGEAQILKGETCLATLKRGDIFGEMAIISKERRSATAVASQNLKVLFLKEKVLKSLIKEIPDLSFSLMTVLAGRLRNQNDDITGDSTDIYATANIPNGLKCSNCFEWNTAGVKKCTYCGHKLGKDYMRLLVVSFLFVAIVLGSWGGYKQLINNTKKSVKTVKVKIPLVSVKKVTYEKIQLQIEKYGRVRASKTHKLAFELQGRVAKLNSRLKKGHIVNKGELLVAISQKEYKNKVKNIKNQIRSIEIRLDELESKKVSIANQIKIVQQQKQLVEKKLRTNSSLYGQQAVSESVVLEIQKELLSFKKSIADLQSQEKQLPNQISVRKLELADAKIKLNEAYANIGKTKIFAPFSARVREVYVEKDSLVSMRNPIAVIEDLNYVEIPTYVPISQIPDLLGENMSLDNIDNLQLAAHVSTTIGNVTHKWQGKVVRFEPMDEKNYTIPVIVRVKNAKGKQILQPGNFVKVNLQGREIEKALLLPITALRENNTVHIVHNGRLQIRKIRVSPYRNKFLVTEGLSEGEMIVLRPLPFVIPGTQLKPYEVAEDKGVQNEFH